MIKHSVKPKMVTATWFGWILSFIWKNPALCCIVLLAFLLRVVGVYPGFPDWHPDEGTSYSTAIYMFFHHLRPDRFDYPAGMPLIHLIIYIVFILPSVFVKLIVAKPTILWTMLGLGDFPLIYLKEQIFGKVGIDALYWSRYIAACFGTGAVVLTYLTSKKLFTKEVGLFAAFFLAVNYRHVLGSHFGLPDIHNSFFNMLALFASVVLLEKNTRNRYIFAAVAAVLPFSLKYQPFAFLPFFFVHLVWAVRKKSFLYLFHRYFFFALFASFLTFVVINPYYFFNLNEVIKQNASDYRWYQMGSIGFKAYPYFYLFYFGIGVLPSIAIVCGMLVMLWKQTQKALLIFTFLVPLFFIMTLYSNGGIFPRNFVSPMPYLMIFAGFAVYQLAILLRRIGKQAYVLPLMLVLLVLINFSSLKNSTIASISMAEPWTVIGLHDWLRDHLPNGITLRHYQLQLLPGGMQTLKQKKVVLKDWDYTQGPNSLAEFQEEGTDFAILNTHVLQDTTYWWRLNLPNNFLLSYTTVPFDYIESGFFGLTIKELQNYTVFEIYKPWQALSTNNYVVYKIPQKPTELGKQIASFGFDRQEDMWTIRGNFGLTPARTSWIKEDGRDTKGELALQNIGITTSRASSKPIPITPGKLYTVKGYIKSTPIESEVENYKDGFLRIDFYSGNTDKILEGTGVSVSISKRASADSTWHEVTTSLMAPRNANYLTVSLQRKDEGKLDLLLDDVSLFETDSFPEEPYKEVPYIKATIPRESIYYNSFL